MRRLLSVLAGIGLIVGIGVVGASLPSSAADQPSFTATFDTAADFYDRFDYGYSGLVAPQNALAPISPIHGDHNLACDGPETQRDVNLVGSPNNLDFSQLFWHCAPGGDPAKGHLMTAVDTFGYNIAWFSPKQSFTNVSKVCWDINETAMSRRKWTQVVFVSAADAVRYPAGGPTALAGIGGTARGTGGFDLGFVDPDFRSPNGPTSGIVSQGDTGGFFDADGTASWFNGSSWTQQFVGPGPPYTSDREQTTDKAARYLHCIEQTAPNVITYTKATPASGIVTRTLAGRIPQGTVRVVFEDDNYDPPKDSPAQGQPDGRYNANNVTWHWDNIQIFAADSPPASTTTAATTTLPTTTMSTTTTVPSTTTTVPSTTTSSTTTTVPASTTTTLAPIPACPSTFNTTERTWCQRVMAHIAVLEAKVGG